MTPQLTLEAPTDAPVSSGAPDASPSRRNLLTRTAVVGAVGAVGATGVLGADLALAPTAQAAYTPRRWRGTKILGPRARHLVGRFSYGVTPALAAQVRRAGGPLSWFEQQLDPTSIADKVGAQVDEWWPSFDRAPREVWSRHIDGVEGGWEVMQDLQRYSLVRRMVSTRQVHETMTEFWQNHLNVSTQHDAVFTVRASYDRTIREHALGSFADLLYATTTHPAMGIYLSNAVSTKDHPNENLGRELLELHTVGRGNYGEEDVKNSARILTGWRVDIWRTWRDWYSLEDHWSGRVQVMGFSDANAPRSEADAKALTRRYTDYLARHPRTAQRIARKLAAKFVGEQPSVSLINQLAQVYLDNDTQIKPVLRALVRTEEFMSSRGSKVKDPGEDLVSTYRALGVKVQRPQHEQAAVNAMLWQCGNLGTSPFAWPTPDGQPLDNVSWSSPSRMLNSMDLHYSMSGGWWPKEGIGYRAHAAWLPRKQIRFDVFVDYLCRTMLHERSTPRMLQACCESVGVRPGTRISADHAVVKWHMARVLSTILDSPAHLTR